MPATEPGRPRLSSWHPPACALLLAGCCPDGVAWQPCEETAPPPDSLPEDSGGCEDPSRCDLDGDGLSAAEGDCDDGDPEVNPLAEETWYDGVDGDCDGASDYDADRDGHDAEDGGGDDCDDSDQGTHPGADEVPRNGRDEDCDGWEDSPISALEGLLFEGESAGNRAGIGLAMPGDVNGDGLQDLLVGAEGMGAAVEGGGVYLVLGPVDHDMGLVDASTRWFGEAGAAAGSALAGLGDMNGDGFADFAAGAFRADATTSPEGTGEAYVIYGSDHLGAELGLGSAGAILSSTEGSSFAGRAVASAGDVDLDGHTDLLVSAGGVDGREIGPSVNLFLGPLEGHLVVTNSFLTMLVSGAEGETGLGLWPATAGDLDGDGYSDMVVGWSGHDSDGASTDVGAVYVVLSRGSGTLVLEASDGVFTGENNCDFAGAQVAAVGDVDHDGYDDLLAGAGGQDRGGDNAGAAYLLRGPATGAASLADAHAILLGESVGDLAGSAVASAGDVDGNGYPDLLVGAPEADNAAGAAYLVLGPVSGARSLGDAELRVLSDLPGDALGSALAGGGDLDGDGYGDILLGAPGHGGVGMASFVTGWALPWSGP